LTTSPWEKYQRDATGFDVGDQPSPNQVQAPAVDRSIGYPALPEQNLTVRALRMKGVTDADIAAGIGNPERMKQLINQNFGPGSVGTESATPGAAVAPIGEKRAWTIAALRGIPLAGAYVDKGAALLNAAAQPWLETGLSHAATFADREAENEQTIKAATDQLEKDHPIATGISKAAVGIAALAPFGATALGARAFGIGGEALLPSILKGATTFGLLNAGDTALRGGDAKDTAKSALFGAAGGIGLPLAGKAVQAAAPFLAPILHDFHGRMGRPGEPMRSYSGSPDGFDSNADVLNVPYEAIPSRDSGHLAGIEKLPQEVQDQFSRSLNFGHGPGGTDIIYDALGMQQLPTIEAQGLWRLTDGSVQQNLANVARPIAGRANGDPIRIDPESLRMFEAAENLRAYGSVQDGVGGQFITRAGKVADMNSILVPTPNGVTREQISELSRRARPYELMDTSDLGSRVDLTNFADDGPSGRELSDYLHRGKIPQNEERIGPTLPPLTEVVREVVPGAGVPVGVSRTGPFVDYSAEWKARPGSGAATGKFLGVLDRMPDLAARLNNSAQIPKHFLAMADRDQGFMAAHGTPKREDVANTHRIIGEGPGWTDRLRAAYGRGEYLPAAALAALGLRAAAQAGGDERSE
jgi:hypothetical protein